MKATAVRWTLQHGLPRAVMRTAARRGDPVTGLVTTKSEVRRASIVERICQDGDISRGSLAWATGAHRMVYRIVRSADFGVRAEFSAYPRILGKIVASSRDSEALRVNEPPTMIALDNPEHARHRRAIASAFTPRAIESWRSVIERFVDDKLDAMAGEDSVDLVPAFASPLPLGVVSRILGVPDDDAELLIELAEGGVRSLTVAQDYADYRYSDSRVRRFNRWARDHIRQTRTSPADNLLSRLITESDFSELELRATIGLLVNAGFMTTSAVICSGVDLLARHPDQLALLRADPTLWSGAVDEILRLSPPLRMTARSALRDTVVEGVPIPAGKRVVVLVDAANRDPGVFPRPDDFDILRPNAREHLSFAGGDHGCVGGGLAKLELMIALRAIFERYPDLEVLPGGERLSTPGITVWAHLPLRLGPSSGRRARVTADAAPASSPAPTPDPHVDGRSTPGAQTPAGCPFHAASGADSR